MEENKKTEPVSGQAVMTVKDLRTALKTRQGILYPVDGVSLEIPKGKIIGLVGESGCGKSMMANSIMNLLPKNGYIAEGSILFQDKELTACSKEERRKLYGNRITLIFQDPMTSLNPVIRVGKQVEEVLKLHKDLSKEESKKAVIQMFADMGIPEPERRYYSFPHELSGGLRQRVMISAAMICRPDLLIADEPTTALDVTIEAQILKQMKTLQKEEGTSVLLITHDLGVVAEVCDLVYVMYAGKIVEAAGVGELFHHPRHPYTEGLLNSLPSGTRGRRLRSIPGVVPILTEMPEGCRFAPRCPYATDACRQKQPQMRLVGDNHQVRCVLDRDLISEGGEANG